MKTLLRSCPICGSAQGEMLYTQKFVLPEDNPLPSDYDIVSCTNCGFTYADTSVGQSVYDSYYKQLSKYEDKNISSGSGSNAFELERIKDTIKEIEFSCPNKNSRIIDIGCANGGILKELKEKGYVNLMGLDPSKKCVNSVILDGITCLQGSILDGELLGYQQFDYIILSHVMEHIYDLNKVFRICFNLISEKGKLYIEVPDAAFYADYYIVPYYYFDSEHINHFDEDSLLNIGSSNGFVKVSTGHKSMHVSSDQLYPALFMVFEKRLNEKIESYLYSIQAKQSIKKYLKLSSDDLQMNTIFELAKSQEEIYVFGAGNFTLRLLASSELFKCNIKAFIDNDQNKQGLTLINKPVVGPDVLRDFDGTVVICSALFADDIKSQVKSINPHISIVIIK